MESKDLKLFLTFYGDDFTGSTDVMESLTMNGWPAVLFLRPPSVSVLNGFRFKNQHLAGQEINALGVAGVSRSMTKEQMSSHLPSVFEGISQIPSRFFHYKVCSTFDSSPHIGNIGHATDIALQYFPSPYIPLLVGAPDLNRFCAFGNLFARVDGITYRLDRHPTMSKHPVTPMFESDLRLHLGIQTERKVNLIDVLTLEKDPEEALKVIDELSSSDNPEFLLFDTINNHHLEKVGEVLLHQYADRTQLLIGSSGVENALARYLHQSGDLEKPGSEMLAAKADKLIVMTGSCAPGTARQIKWALANGFEDIRIDTVRLVDPETRKEEMGRIIDTAKSLLTKSHILLYSALGPEDPAIEETRKCIKEVFPDGNCPTDFLASMQGGILKAILEDHPDARVTVAGGDTSGHVSLALEIEALEMLAPIAPGAPLCIAHSKNPKFDGMEIALKGGQNGNEKYFGSILNGRLLN